MLGPRGCCVCNGVFICCNCVRYTDVKFAPSAIEMFSYLNYKRDHLLPSIYSGNYIDYFIAITIYVGWGIGLYIDPPPYSRGLFHILAGLENPCDRFTASLPCQQLLCCATCHPVQTHKPTHKHLRALTHIHAHSRTCTHAHTLDTFIRISLYFLLFKVNVKSNYSIRELFKISGS